jgi:tRNA A37 threonylcarbamoyladenosine synthetase subunit TsaC/SUA5/YrdC
VTQQPTYEDPSLIEDELGAKLDLVVDGGKLSGDPSSVISLIDEEIEVLRHGSGDISWIK